MNFQGLLVAIKRLFSREKKDFDQERDMLVSLTRKDHRHLVKLVTTYQFNGHYHLLCPMAKANLRDYWKVMKPLGEKDKSYLWALTNIAGIASGLNLIHNFRTKHRAEPDKTNSTISQSRPSWKFRMTLAPNEEFFGRHGDLKPENILWVTDTEGINDAGVLQISDFGQAVSIDSSPNLRQIPRLSMDRQHMFRRNYH
jgi:serine/threonine protein kinase